MPYTPSAREALLKWVRYTAAYHTPVCTATASPSPSRPSPPRTPRTPQTPNRRARANPGRSPQVNAFPDVDPATAWSDLADGILLSQVLQDLDEQYDAADIDRDPPPSTPKWLVKKKNLQALHKALVRYIHRECPEYDALVRSADWRTLAEDPNEEALVKVDPRDRSVHVTAYDHKLTRIAIQLVSTIVGVAFLGPDPGKYVLRLQNSADFDDKTKMEIQQIIMAKDAEAKKAAEMADLDDSVDQALGSTDADLAFEQERGALLAQLEVAKKQHADTITRLEHLQDSYDSLTLEETKLQRELEVLRKATQDGATGSQVVKALEDKINELEELIATQEGQIEDDRMMKDRLNQQVATLTEKADLVEKMSDELQVLRHQAGDLTRKANTAERLRQKLEQQTDLKNEVENLKFEKDDLLERTKEYPRMRQKIEALEKTLGEVREAQANAEEAVFFLTNQKRVLEENRRAAEEDLIKVKDMRAHDERYILELQEQAGQSETGGQSLEDELEGKPSAPGLSLEVSRLRAENALLRRNAEAGDTPQLQIELEEEQRRRAELQERYSEIVERHAVSQDQVSALVNDAAGEGSVSKRNEALSAFSAVMLNDYFHSTRAFGELKKQLMQAELDGKRDKERAEELGAQLADRDRDLLMARAELEAAAKGDVEAAIEALKATDGLISTGLRDELNLLRSRVKSLAEELDVSKTQVIEAFVAKDKFRKELDELAGVKGRIEDKSISDETIAQDVGKLSEKIERLRERLVTRQEVSGPLTPSSRKAFKEIGDKPVVPGDPEEVERPVTPFAAGPPAEEWEDVAVESPACSPVVARTDDEPVCEVQTTGMSKWAPGKGNKLDKPRKKGWIRSLLGPLLGGAGPPRGDGGSPPRACRGVPSGGARGIS